MKRHVLAVLCIGTVLGASVAWTQDPLGFELNTDLINDLSPNVEDTPSRVRDDALREQLLRLVEEKARLMDREALEEALSEIEGDIGELQARQKLEEARRLLNSILEEHQGTEGAHRAQRMLETDDTPLLPSASPHVFGNPI